MTDETKKLPGNLPGSVFLGAIVVAGGSSRRYGGERPKQYVLFEGRPLLVHTLEALLAEDRIQGLVVVLPAEDLDEAPAILSGSIRSELKRQRPIRFVAGGPSRADSVARGLAALDPSVGQVLVHDGARPVLSRALLERLIRALEDHPAAIPGLRPTDTIKRVDETGRVLETMDRDRLVRVQTPQAFDRRVLEEAFDALVSERSRFTDCAAMVESRGIEVRVVRGEETNVKITTPLDLKRLEEGRSPCS